MTSSSKASSEKKVRNPFIVGIGASAGGLEAFQSLLPNLPTEAGFAYVIVQHLDPSHPTMLTSLLKRYTEMRVEEVSNGQKPEMNTISVTPPGRNVIMQDGRLSLVEPASATGPKPSIDLFFTSLAEDRHDKAVGIILSGTGSDGAHGIRSIKAEGGITIVQETETARYGGMPEAAIGTGHVDLILSPAKMGEELISILEYPQLLKAVSPADKKPDDVNKILQMIKDRQGADFSDYKKNTINRRIGRRMAVHKFTDIEDYVRYLEKTPEELALLVKDILISVTSFFRDAEAFKALGEILPEMIERKEDGDSIRLWVPGCSTGEEAYSIAILLAQILGERIKRFEVQIFGTDLDEEAIMKARKGIYPEATAVDVEPKILERFFLRKDNMVQVVEPIREMIVFAKHNLIDDPPFAHLDLISCRNMLIYFNQNLQNRVVSTFHYVLNPGGYLFLGKSESIAQFSDLFAPVSKKWRIFETKPALKNSPSFIKTRTPILGAIYRKSAPKPSLSAKETINEAILKFFSPASVLIDEQMQGLYFRGDTGSYFQPPEGGGSLDILQMAKNEIRLDLRTLVHRSRRDNEPTVGRPLKINVHGIERYIVIHVNPVNLADAQKGLMLVSFEELATYQTKERELPPAGKEDPRVYELEEELNETRERLQTTIEELETTNEELMSLNEELQSSNEELQSSNEELETTSEELQSTNEELNTVNEELQAKSAELSMVNNDLENIISQIGLPMVILDRNLKVKRYNEAATSIFSISAGDLGQVITTVGTRLDLPELRKKIRIVIESKEALDEDVENSDSYYYMRIHPILDASGQSIGAMLIFVDKTALLRKENQLEVIGLISQVCLQAMDLEVLYRELPEILSKRLEFPYVAIDFQEDNEILTLGSAGFSKDDDGPVRVSMDATVSGEVISSQEPMIVSGDTPAEVLHPLLKDVEVRTLICSPFCLSGKTVGTLVLADSENRPDAHELQDTLMIIGHHLALEIDRKQVTDELRQQNETLQKIMDHIPVMLCFYDDTSEIDFVNEEFTRLLGWSLNELKGMENPLEVLYPDVKYRKEVWEYMMEASFEWRDFSVRTRDGKKLDSSWSNVRLSDGSQIGIGIDLRERRKRERELERSEERFRILAETIEDVFWMRTPGLEKMLYVSPAYEKIWGRKCETLYDDPRSFIKAIHPADRDRVKAALDQHAEGEWHVEYRIEPENGILRWIDDRGFPVRDEKGNLRFMVGTATDISELKKVEAELKQKNEALRDFSYVASHDLREPLRKVVSFTDILREDYAEALDEGGQDIFGRIINATQRMQDLLSALLQYSSIGWNPEKAKPVELNKVLGEALKNLSVQIEQTHAQIDSESLPTVEGDETLLTQLFQNLLNNSLKFSREGHSPKVRITAKRVIMNAAFPSSQEKGAAGIRIQVKDNGIGFEPELVETVFKPFQRLHGRSAYPGTGMGLAICQRIVERHGGLMSAKSQPGKGSIFEVVLPLKQVIQKASEEGNAVSK
ncbi:CheR methyltransferase, SAM binding domain protein [delta proteobacterium NaphS2]|nr:CheR methyltransferase, SAM binding domain protein [delta proteobacterium NaphS2]